VNQALIDVATALLKRVNDTTEAEPLARILEGCPAHTLSDGEQLCREGEKGTGQLWILVSGNIQVFKRDLQGVDHSLTLLSAPNMLGHMGAVLGASRSATCKAHGMATVRVLESRRLAYLMDDVGPQGDVLRRLLIATMSAQLNMANDKLNRMLRDDSTVTEKSLDELEASISSLQP
jgi:CRP-like cAMP-binding protein